MATSNKHASANQSTAPAGNLATLADQTGPQMAVAVEMAAVLCRNLNSLQQVQHHSTQRTSLRLQQAAEQMRGMSNPGEFMTIQANLINTSVQELAQVMQDMALAMLRAQGMLMQKQDELTSAASATTTDSARAATAASANGTADTMSAAAEATKVATAAMLQPWLSLMGMGTSANGNGRSSAHH